MSDAYLRFDAISVVFPGVRALDGVSFSAHAGEVHALMGENGAGKSTLLKVLSGVNRVEEGALWLDGQRHVFSNAREALREGIAIIYQELTLSPNMSVAENLLLGQLPSRRGFINRRQLKEKAMAILADLGEGDIHPSTKVRELSIGQQQMIEIGRALLRDAKVIAFDEPTSSLSIQETRQLKRIVQRLRDEGRVVLYVTHRMEEVFEMCDAVTIFRDGKHIRTHEDMSTLNNDLLVSEMVGRDINDVYGYRAREHGEVVLNVEGIEGRGLKAPVSFSVKRGEVFGLFGLVGAGRSELLRLVCGVESPKAGSVTFNGESRRFKSPGEAIRAGIAMCPEDRKSQGIFPVASVADNLNISCRRFFKRWGLFRHPGRERRNAESYIQQLSIKTPGPRSPIGKLSGGNQQKVILARWLAEEIDLFVMDEPTRGIDVGARRDIYSLLYDLADQGKSVVVISSDIAEVSSICDRIAVMRDGELVDVVPRESATPERLLGLALPA
ncbi:L-arabinose ABC transporter ATP-binding protein AraG [Halomonas sp. ISL-60]|uniref:L-arabinose ABC transporter ATP-binding protein AraG n=1 Tax=unclassified Halomonas TaxID=2609666 RepID=UPI0007D8DFA5|nr:MULTISPECIES: L-arabinose ABC transporter ATP-binding protein AraG [unclassified Halomonas]MBT2772401.1 L-arabinose ABC transporter ATP-binding protein AraG [Halomonas sp. ISL-60]MBT2786051.1 L-arabinose ABC transporter ATP-binding protein AraG [Halomonas sp. ISL-106]MBT2797073.1 L-arabinose ABC transporter ATP-binding protein AraG [Halomonas sp. ISL-104]MBT2803418.1 L-arabinose ABC transporter ATP-binding protein AraG [Halomonas sp. ISL-56]OAL58456.1 L-arabinose transporter ATP-binding pro